MSRNTLAALSVALLLAVVPVQASTILYDSVGEANFEQGYVPTIVGYFRNIQSDALAMPFRPISQGTVTQVVFAGYRTGVEFVNTRVEVWTSDAEIGGLPGQLLAFTDCLCHYGDGILNTVLIDEGPLLDPAVRYWVAVRRLEVPTNPALGWTMNTLGIQSQVAFQTAEGSWVYDTIGAVNGRKPQAAFRVVGEAAVVPLPGAAGLLLSGVALLWELGRRRSSGFL